MKIAVVGCSGKYGKLISKVILESDAGQLSGVAARQSSGLVGKDIGPICGLDEQGITVTDQLNDIFQEADAVIDFTAPEASLEHLKLAVETKTIFVCGTTGFSEEEFQAFNEAGKTIPVLWSSNMSFGANLLGIMTELLASKLNDDFDIEIMDMHHGSKIDAPSGTALSIGKLAAAARGVNFNEVAKISREGKCGPRKKGEIGFASLRGGSVIADCTVFFADLGERLELTHRADDSIIFAKGAVEAALWLKGKAPRLYAMRDVLGL